MGGGGGGRQRTERTAVAPTDYAWGLGVSHAGDGAPTSSSYTGAATATAATSACGMSCHGSSCVLTWHNVDDVVDHAVIGADSILKRRERNRAAIERQALEGRGALALVASPLLFPFLGAQVLCSERGTPGKWVSVCPSVED